MEEHIMSIKSLYIGRPRAAVLASALKQKGYDVNLAQCQGYALNVARQVGGAADQKEVLSIIEELFAREE
jgi:hypothetical protein